MAVTAEQMYTQVENLLRTLEKMTAKQREEFPSKQFTENYNAKLALAKEAMPNADSRRWPPVVEIFVSSMGQVHAEGKFVEFHSYYAEMQAILAEGLESGYTGFRG